MLMTIDKYISIWYTGSSGWKIKFQFDAQQKKTFSEYSRFQKTYWPL